MAPGAFLGSNFGMAIEIHSRRDPILLNYDSFGVFFAYHTTLFVNTY